MQNIWLEIIFFCVVILIRTNKMRQNRRRQNAVAVKTCQHLRQQCRMSTWDSRAAIDTNQCNKSLWHQNINWCRSSVFVAKFKHIKTLITMLVLSALIIDLYAGTFVQMRFSDKNSNCRSSCSDVFCKKDELKYFATFTGKHVCQRAWCFLVNYAKCLGTSFFIEYLRRLLL